MNGSLLLAIAFGFFIILVVCWFGWRLLCQNGRILLRLDELEKRLNELEFGGADEPEGLPPGSEAPAFELPDLAGERKTPALFRGQSVLLIFFNPECGFCREMMPKLEAVQRSEDRGQESEGEQLPLLLILTTGDAEKNRKFFAEHKVGCPVLLQNDGKVAKAYQVNGTPAGYLISAEGKIASELAMGAEALLKLATESHSSRREEAQTSGFQPSTLNSQSEDQSLVTSAATNGDARADRCSQRSVARSKIKRDGLKAGTRAPDFRLPRLDGRSDLTLSELRSKRVMLVFSSPGCGPCNALAPELEKFYRAHQGSAGDPAAPLGDPPSGMAKTNTTSNFTSPGLPAASGESPEGTGGSPMLPAGRERGIAVVMISKGEPKDNRAKVKEHGLTFPVVLQQQWEISRRYAMFATPIAYLIDEAGVIVHDVAVGAHAIEALMKKEVEPRMHADQHG